jgi:hypothetical protein
MKFYAEAYMGEQEEKKITIELLDSSDIYGAMEAIRSLLIAIGYHEDSVLDGCNYLLEEHEYIKENNE